MFGIYCALEKRIIKERYWFANEVMNKVNEQSKNNDIKLMEGRVQMMKF